MGQSDMTPQQSVLKHGIDAVAAGGVIASLIGYLPAIAAVMSILWFAIQIIEKLSGEKIHATIMRAVKCFRKPS